MVDAKKRKKWKTLFCFVTYVIRFSLGLFQSLFGTTMLFMADNTGSSVAQVAFIHTGRAVGLLLGSISCSLLIGKYKNFPALKTTSLIFVTAGVVMVFVPLITNLPLLIAAISFTGFSAGFFDSGVVSLFLKAFGEVKSRPVLQAYHFAVCLGSTLSPIIAAPFLEMAEMARDVDDDATRCSNGADANATSALAQAIVTNSSASASFTVNPVAWPYFASGFCTIISSFALLYLAFTGVERRMFASSSSSQAPKDPSRAPEKREPLSEVVWILLSVIFVYMSFSGLERIFENFVFLIALCSELSFTVANAAWLNTLYWLGMVTGRGLGIFVARKLKPRTLLMIDLGGTTLLLIFFAAFGESSPTLTWIVPFFLGLCNATFYSSGISWTSQMMNVSTTYLFVFSLGNGIGSMISPPIAGKIFEKDPFYLPYLLLGLCGSNAVGVALLWLAGRKRLKAAKNTAEY